MAYVLTDESNYEDIADAIREKTESSDTYTPSEMAGAIRSIPTSVTGVKGNAESTYRTGNVNITPANIGAKALQASVASPSASGTAIEFIDTISQDAQGVITPTKKTVREATTSQSGLMSGTDKSRLDSIRSSMLKELKYYLDLPYPIKTGTCAKMEEYPDPNIGCAKIDILTAEDNTPDKWLFGKSPYYAYVANTQMELDDLDARATAAEADITALQSALAASEAKRMAMYPTGTLTGPVAAFPDGAEDVPVKALTVNITSQTGVTGLTLTHTGKNLWPDPYDPVPVRAPYYKPVFVGDNTVTLSTTMPKNTSNSTNLFLLAGIQTGGAVSGTNGVSANTPRTVTAIDGYVTVCYRNADGVDPRDYNTQLEIGDAATDFEAYQAPDEYTITFPAEAGTVYGGTLDVTNGLLTVNAEYMALPTIAGTAVSGTTRRWYTYPNYTGKRVVSCDSLTASDINRSSDVGYAFMGTDGRICVTPPWAQEITTVSDFNAALAEHPINIVLTTTPVSYQLDPVEVRTLLGANTFSADAREVAVTYRADIALYIARKIAETNT